MTGKIVLGSSWSHRGGDDLARSHREAGNQGLRAMANVLKFAQFDVAFDHRAGLVFALCGLDAGLFVRRDQMHPSPSQPGRLLVEIADGLDLGIKRLRILRPLIGEPIPPLMGFEIGLVLKNVPHCGGRSS